MKNNLILLNEMVEQGYVNVQKHPTAELYIYNYSQSTQYEQLWNEVTLACRGLILDKNKEVVARPFTKFFNWEESDKVAIPNETFEVFEKMDGSLGILYWVENQPFIATRGSFNSKQAQKASDILYQKYAHTFDILDRNCTYLFEIIYPENRIVLDYGEMEDLILLAIVDNLSGKEKALQSLGFPLVKKYDGLKDIATLKKLEEANKEGFVIKFENGLRIKVKFAEYVRIHRIITQVSSLTIWEYLKEKKNFEEILEKVPDEFYQWVRKTHQELLDKFQVIENQCKVDFKVLDTRKETALYFQTCAYPSVLFDMLLERDYAPNIWKRIRPDFQKPFQNEEEN